MGSIPCPARREDPICKFGWPKGWAHAESLSQMSILQSPRWHSRALSLTTVEKLGAGKYVDCRVWCGVGFGRKIARCRPATDIESNILKPARPDACSLVQEHGTARTHEVPRFRSVDATLRCRGRWWKEAARGSGRIQLKIRDKKEEAPVSPEGLFTHNIFGLELRDRGLIIACSIGSIGNQKGRDRYN